MKQHIVPSIVASLVAGAVALSAAHYAEPTHRVTIVAPGAVNQRAVTRADRFNWGELEQPEIDAITTALKALPAKKDVTIFCMDDSRCADLALDLENAFESAHWPVRQDKPIMDTTQGIGVSDDGVAALIDKATGGRFPVTKILNPMPSGLAIALGAKPR